MDVFIYIWSYMNVVFIVMEIVVIQNCWIINLKKLDVFYVLNQGFI